MCVDRGVCLWIGMCACACACVCACVWINVFVCWARCWHCMQEWERCRADVALHCVGGGCVYMSLCVPVFVGGMVFTACAVSLFLFVCV